MSIYQTIALISILKSLEYIGADHLSQ